MRPRSILTGAALAVAITAFGSAEAFAGDHRGFKTAQPSMLDPVMPAFTSYSVAHGRRHAPPTDLTFESIPDGISVRKPGGKRGRTLREPRTQQGPVPGHTHDHGHRPGRVAERLRQRPGEPHLARRYSRALLTSGTFAIASAMGFQRVCSTFLATSAQGFDRPILFTNEESPDWVFRQEESLTLLLSNEGPAEEARCRGRSRREQRRDHLDLRHGTPQPRRSAVALPGYEELVVLSGDDTFTSGALHRTRRPRRRCSCPSQSQLYSYNGRRTPTRSSRTRGSCGRSCPTPRV